MRELDVVAVVFALLTLFIGWLVASALRDGEVSSRGATATRRGKPVRFWLVIALWSVLGLVSTGFALMAAFSPLR